MTATLLDRVGVAMVVASAVLLALLETLLVPLYAGSVPVPLTIALALGGNIVLPLVARSLVRTLLSTALPFLAWLVVVIGFGVVSRPEGDVILPGGSIQWVSYTLMLAGALAGTITVVIAAPQARSRSAATTPSREPEPTCPAARQRPPKKGSG